MDEMYYMHLYSLIYHVKVITVKHQKLCILLLRAPILFSEVRRTKKKKKRIHIVVNTIYRYMCFLNNLHSTRDIENFCGMEQKI